MTFRDLFYNLSEFSMTYNKQLLSRYCHINLLFKVFMHTMMHKICASVIFLLELKSAFWLICCFFNFWSFSLFILTKSLFSHNFPWPTHKFHDFPGLENDSIKFQDFPSFPWPIQILSLYTLLLAALTLAMKKVLRLFYKSHISPCHLPDLNSIVNHSTPERLYAQGTVMENIL